jgi:RimJ/RimL family protein N-acetyltransferase
MLDSFEKDIKIRRATALDADLLFTWLNDPIARARSIQKEKVDYQSHLNWILPKLKDENFDFLIFELNSIPIGLFRLNKIKDSYWISFMVDQKYREKGIGVLIVSMGIEFIANIKKVPLTLYAHVSVENIPSSKIFLKNNFNESGKEILNNEEYLVYKKNVNIN